MENFELKEMNPFSLQLNPVIDKYQPIMADSISGSKFSNISVQDLPNPFQNPIVNNEEIKEIKRGIIKKNFL